LEIWRTSLPKKGLELRRYIRVYNILEEREDWVGSMTVE
jgi:hypothetical protein